MGMIGAFAQLNNDQFSRVLSNPLLLEGFINDSKEKLDVDKSWEAIYYILTGSALAEDASHPLGRIIFSHQHFDDNQDMGYGPAHYLSPDDVKTLNQDLQAISAADVKSRYNGEEMDEKGIYPEVWSEEESYEYLEQNFLDLKTFFQTASDKNNAIVSYIY